MSSTPATPPSDDVKPVDPLATSLPATIQASSFRGSPAASCLIKRLDATACGDWPSHASATFAPTDRCPLAGVVFFIGSNVELGPVPVGFRRRRIFFACFCKRSPFDSTPVRVLVVFPHAAASCAPDVGVPLSTTYPFASVVGVKLITRPELPSQGGFLPLLRFRQYVFLRLRANPF